MSSKIQILFIFLVASSNVSSSLKILGLFPQPIFSHFHFFHPIMRGLADAGHDVTVVSHFPDKNSPVNYHDIPLPKKALATNSLNLELLARRAWYKSFQEFFEINKWGVDDCEHTMNSSAIEEILSSNTTYDVILVEQFNSDCMMAVAWKLKAPVIGLSSCILMPWHYDRLGQPQITSYVPNLFVGSSDKMTYMERLQNWVITNGLKLLYQHISLAESDRIARKYLKDENMPHVSEIVKNTSMMFVNSHSSFSGSKPTAPTVIELGGIHMNQGQPIDDELKSILDASTDGVIYVSWGSMIRADSLPDDKRDALLKAFESFKQTVVWKWENDTLPNQPKNVVIRKWMAQADILCHPNVRVFVSHGGLGGSSESAHCGVPMVLTPINSDQFLNAAAAESRGMGWIVHYADISAETMKAAINNALTPSALESAKKVSYSYRNRMTKPIDTAIWWVEYVAATGGAPFLQSHSKNLSAFVYYSFDVYATIAILLIAILVLVSAIIFYTWKLIIYIVKQKLCKNKFKPQQPFVPVPSSST